MKRPSALHVLLALSALLLAAGLVYTVRGARVDWGDDPRHLVESERAARDADKAAGRAQRDFHARRGQEAEASARAGLGPARELLAACETRDPNSPDVQRDLVQAALAFGRWLELRPDDVDILQLRARAWELRRFGEKAAADFQRLIELKPELAPALRDRLARAKAGYPLTK
ncbi:MAG TPA: hypothetical protein VEJ18_15935 [Planctomycetota bacterium]|nr:hypothetical protein [Planctomycetota bacterium]